MRKLHSNYINIHRLYLPNVTINEVGKPVCHKKIYIFYYNSTTTFFIKTTGIIWFVSVPTSSCYTHVLMFEKINYTIIF